jgi:ribonuclease HII
MTLSQIREFLASGSATAAEIAAIAEDSREGARRLVTAYHRQQTLLEKAAAERIRMLSHETAASADGFACVCGVDEAGRGPLAGPVVAAAVVFPPGVYIQGVKDSKKLTPVKREELFALIAEAASDYGIGSADPQEIDRINILHATHLAMRRAVEALHKSRPDLALVDGLPVRGLPCVHRAIVSGDALSFTIAAASILAKVTRDRLMAQYDVDYPEYGFAGNKGYGTPEHIEALRRFGPSPIHRRSFNLFLPTLFDTLT